MRRIGLVTFSPLRLLLIGVALAVGFGALTVWASGVASAHHGSWHHNFHFWNSNPGEYRGYAHSEASQGANELWARFIVLDDDGFIYRAESDECQSAGGFCPDATTDTFTFPQGAGTIVSRHCGRAGSDYIQRDFAVAGVCPFVYSTTYNGYDQHSTST